MLVLDKGVVGWEASSRNGGGASHYQSPLFHEEQRLWPQMDDLLGYPTEYRRERVIFATTEHHLATLPLHGRRCAGASATRSTTSTRSRCASLCPLAGDNVLGGIHLHFGGQANPQRTVQAYAWALQDLGGRILQHTPATRIRDRRRPGHGGRDAEGVFACDHLVVAAGPQARGAAGRRRRRACRWPRPAPR